MNLAGVAKSIYIVGLLVLCCLFFAVRGFGAAPEVHVLAVNGPIVPVVYQYLDRGIREAEEAGVVCVIELNTPGGLYETTQEIVSRIMNARVPIVVYVNPAGGWAASAGTFITTSAHVAAMAPGSRIGAAHPVALGFLRSEVSKTEEKKITEDAAAWMRSIAQARGRDPSNAEQTVIESRSFSDQEALEAGLIDLRASSLQELLTMLDGRQVVLADGKEIEMRTATADPKSKNMNWMEDIVLAVSDPNVAYVLLIVGLLGVVLEFFNPGTVLPGVLGGASLFLALYAMGSLKAHWGGILLIILAFALFAAEAFVVSHGALAAGGLTALVLGSLMLFGGSSHFPVISLGLIIGMTLGLAAFFSFLVGAVVRGQKRRVVTGREALVGETGKALTPLNPIGMVLVEGEHWQATVEEGEAGAGELVVVTGIEGLKLRVKRAGEVPR